MSEGYQGKPYPRINPVYPDSMVMDPEDRDHSEVSPESPWKLAPIACLVCGKHGSEPYNIRKQRGHGTYLVHIECETRTLERLCR